MSSLRRGACPWRLAGVAEARNLEGDAVRADAREYFDPPLTATGSTMRRLLIVLFFPLSLLPRAVWQGLAILALAWIGAKSIHDGWRMLDLRAIRVIGEPGYIRIDGGVGELALGVLALMGAYALSRHWLSPGQRKANRRRGAGA